MNLVTAEGIATPRAADIVADQWGLTGPLRFAVLLLLDCGAVRDQAALLRTCRFFVRAARAQPWENRQSRESPLTATAVAAAFDLGVLAKAVLFDLRWAALAGSAVERHQHLDAAMERMSMPEHGGAHVV